MSDHDHLPDPFDARASVDRVLATFGQAHAQPLKHGGEPLDARLPVGYAERLGRFDDHELAERPQQPLGLP